MAEAIAWYSDLELERAIIDCFVEYYVIKESPRKKVAIFLEWRESEQPVQLELL